MVPRLPGRLVGRPGNLSGPAGARPARGRSGGGGAGPPAGPSRTPRQPVMPPAGLPRPMSHRRTTFTTRAAVLGVIVCALMFTLAYPLRLYVSQRGQIRDLEAQERVQQERAVGLRQDVRRYDDPAYVRSEARRRLHFLLPGEKDYLLSPPRPRPAAPARGGVVPPRPGEASWYGELWRSAQAAGRSAAR